MKSASFYTYFMKCRYVLFCLIKAIMKTILYTLECVQKIYSSFEDTQIIIGMDEHSI